MLARHKYVILFFVIISFNLFAEGTLNKKKISGPECTSHLIKDLAFKAESAYQICSAQSEAVKICLIKSRNLNKQEQLIKCHQK